MYKGGLKYTFVCIQLVYFHLLHKLGHPNDLHYSGAPLLQYMYVCDV